MAKTHKAAVYGLGFALFILLFLLKFGPVSFTATAIGLDPSWKAALAWATEHRLAFGSQVVFTGGPLSAIYSRHYVGEDSYAIAIFSLLIALFLALSTLRISLWRGGGAGALLAFLLIYLSPVASDTFLILVPVLTGLVFLEKTSKNIAAHAIIGAYLSGIVILAKFSAFPLSLFVTLLMDVISIRRRSLPLMTVSLVIGMLSGFMAVGQPVSRIPAFVLSSLEMSSGFSSAMSVPGRWIEVVGWLAVATVFVAALARDVYLRRAGSDWTLGTARVLIVCAFLFIVWKAGFVRHDLHSVIAWSGLSIAIMLLGAVSLRPVSGRWALMFGLCAVTIAVPHWLIHEATGLPTLATPAKAAGNLRDQLVDTVDLIVRPANWLGRLQDEEDKALAEIKENRPLPVLDGTVDIIPSYQSDLIANNQQFTPRPTLQEYATYTPKLIARNRAFFEGDRAPDYLLMAPGSIDNRHPASGEGALWPLFFASYQPEMELPNYVLLKKRATPVANIEGASTEIDGRIGDQIAVPDHDGPVMVSIKMHPTVLGRLIDFIFRPTHSDLLVTYDNGKTDLYRLIPGMAAEGFLISPLVSTNLDYMLASTGHSVEAGMRRAKYFSVNVRPPVWLAYQPEMKVVFTPLNDTALQQAGITPMLSDKLADVLRVNLIVANNPLNGTTLAQVPEGILAHAPTTLNIPVAPNSSMKLAFGIREGAWKDGAKTDGACFIAQAGSSILMQKCLDPLNNEADKLQQEQVITIPSGVSAIELKTVCGKTCDWGWSYWNTVSVQK